MKHIIPQLRDRLPELMAFLQILSAEHAAGNYESWQDFETHVREFYTPTMMDKIEGIVPGWKNMAGYANEQTLIHVTATMISLFQLPEYENALPQQQKLAEWIVLLHDLGKKPGDGSRDYTHGFVSATLAGKALIPAGFSATEKYNVGIEQWQIFVSQSIRKKNLFGLVGEPIQDNRRLPEIFNGIDLMFGKKSPPSLVIKGILLHMSITVVKEWPQAAPLSSLQIRQFIDAELLPLLEMIMLVDSDAWMLFEHGKKRQYREETKAVFAGMRQAFRL